MKATSKLISVVLILAMCLSMFAVSAFADSTVVITDPSRKVTDGFYRGSGAGQVDQNGNQENEQSVTNSVAETPAEPAKDGFAEVGTADELQAAIASKTETIRLMEQIAWDGVLNLDYNVKIDLGGKGKGLAFSGSGNAAIISSANAELFNGNIFVSGVSVADESEEVIPGFLTVADAVEGGSVYLHGVYVKFTEAGDNGIFGDGVRLGNGIFSQNVAKYYAEGDLEENYVVVDETASGGMYDVTAKPATPVVVADNENNEAPENEGGKVEPLVGTCVTEEGTITVTVSGKNLPEGLSVEVKPLDNSILQAGEDEEVLFVVDITLYRMDENGEKQVYEPADDPNVPEVNVTIRHPALGNVEEGEAVTLYHIVKGNAVPVASAEEVQGENALEFSTDSFSPYGATAGKTTGSDGQVHYVEVSINGKDIYVYGDGSSNLEFSYTGGKDPIAVSILPYEDALSGDYDTYVAKLLNYEKDKTSYPDTDYTISTAHDKITILAGALQSAPDGKYGVVFWFEDKDNAVYMVQPVIIVRKAGVAGTGSSFTPKAPDTLNEGVFDVEMCDNDSVRVKLTSELKSFSITGNGANITYDSSNPKKIDINGKLYNASEFFSVGENYASDPVGHEFVSGMGLILHSALIKKLDWKDGYTLTVVQDGGATTDTGTFTLNVEPGITVADGLDDYIKGRNLWVKFQACAPIDYDSDGTLAIWIGGQKISHEYYSISNDHQTLWIYRNLLDQLKSNNRYTLKARLWGTVLDASGNKVRETWYPAEASFNVLAAGSTSSKSPKTGDESNIALWASVLVLSGGAVVALIPKKKKSGVK